MKMGSKFLIIIALCFFSTLQADAPNCRAILAENEALFNLLPFGSAGYYRSLDNSGGNYLYTLSLCKPQVYGCNGEAFATVLYDRNSEFCDDIATGYPQAELYNQEDPEAGIKLVFPKQVGQSSSFNYELTVELICNAELTDVSNTNFTFKSTSVGEGNNTEVTVTATGYSAYGCPYASVGRLAAFISEYRLLFVIIFFIIGIIICFFGLKMFNLTTFIISTVIITLALAYFFYNFADLDTDLWVVWIVFILCLAVGSIGGIFAVRYKKIGFFGLGFGLGVVVALCAYRYIILLFFTAGNAILYSMALALGLVGGLLTFKIWRGMAIVATSIIGSYLIVRSASIYIGGFPSETALANGVAVLTVWSYLYIFVLVVVAGAGMRYQFKKKSDTTEEKLLGEDIQNKSLYREILLENV